jgi:hypothetical protein
LIKRHVALSARTTQSRQTHWQVSPSC